MQQLHGCFGIKVRTDTTEFIAMIIAGCAILYGHF